MKPLINCQVDKGLLSKYHNLLTFLFVQAVPNQTDKWLDADTKADAAFLGKDTHFHDRNSPRLHQNVKTKYPRVNIWELQFSFR